MGELRRMLIVTTTDEDETFLSSDTGGIYLFNYLFDCAE